MKKGRGKRKKARWNIEGVLYCQKCANKWFIANKKTGPKKPTHTKLGKRIYPNLKQKRKTITARVLKLRVNATPAELAFKKKIERIGVSFQFQRGFIKGKGYAIVDFYVPSKKLCIEIDGGYHTTPEQQKKDKWRDRWLVESRKLTVKRITNDKAFKMSVGDIKELIGI